MSHHSQNLFSAINVQDGNIVHMSNGDTVEIRETEPGWFALFCEGKQMTYATNSRHVVSCLVYVYPSEDI